MQKPINGTVAILMMLAGISTALIWKTTGLSSFIYEVLPGMTAGILVYFIGQFFISGNMKAASKG
ncbi:MAG: hypothetical protein MJK14_03680 [Rivularia sp. ALOHA_DT_140]|nr:hypothetical protein [Rivularia sp. ALOHA_DT_140]